MLHLKRFSTYQIELDVYDYFNCANAFLWSHNSEIVYFSSGGDPQSSEDALYAKSLTVSPMDGTLRGYDSIKVRITYSPNLIVPAKGFVRQHLSENKEVRKIERKVRRVRLYVICVLIILSKGIQSM